MLKRVSCSFQPVVPRNLNRRFWIDFGGGAHQGTHTHEPVPEEIVRFHRL
jgi:hypothetical protein